MSEPPASSSPTPPVSPSHESPSQSAQPSPPDGDAPPVFPTPVASPGNRVGAMICDGTVLFVLTGIALSLVGELFGDWGSIMDDPPRTVWAHHPEAAFSLTLVFALVVFLYCLPAVLPGRFNGRTPGHVMCSTRLVCLDGKSVVAE